MPETAKPENWVDVASIENVREQGAVEVVVGTQIIAVFWANDSLYAIDGMCAHQGGPVAKGRVEGGCVTCPWHGWQYELATGIQTINRQPLQRTYEVRQNGDRVEVLAEAP